MKGDSPWNDMSIAKAIWTGNPKRRKERSNYSENRRWVVVYGEVCVFCVSWLCASINIMNRSYFAVWNTDHDGIWPLCGYRKGLCRECLKYFWKQLKRGDNRAWWLCVCVCVLGKAVKRKRDFDCGKKICALLMEEMLEVLFQNIIFCV